jgi:hypothetical protein
MSAVILLAAGAAAASATSVATASTVVTPTALGFGVSPNPVTYGSTAVTLSGALLANNTPVTVPGEKVAIEDQVGGKGSPVLVATATTDATGNFTATANLAMGGIFEAVFAGDAAKGYGPSTSSPVNVQSSPAAVTITLTSVPKSPVTAGTTVTLAGRVQVTMPDSTLRPLAGAPTDLYRSGSDTGIHTTSGKDGSFRLSLKPSASANWEVEVIPADPWPYNLYAESISQAVYIDALHLYGTRVLGFTVPATHEIHSAFRISGTAQERSGSAWTAARSVWVDYYYRVLPSGKWVHAGSGRTNSRGVFSWQAGLIKLGHTRWQVRVRSQRSGDIQYLASSSGTHDSFFTDRTYIAHFVALHLNGTTSLGAIMQDYPSSGGVSYTTPQGVAKFYHRAKGSGTWQYVGSARTDSYGSVAIDLSGTVSGYFRIVFPAQGFFLGSTSNTEYLS